MDGEELSAEEKPEKKSLKPIEKELKSIFSKISHLLPKVLLAKTSVCNHGHGCVENVVRKALKNFFIGFSIQLILKNILFIAKPTKLL